MAKKSMSENAQTARSQCMQQGKMAHKGKTRFGKRWLSPHSGEPYCHRVRPPTDATRRKRRLTYRKDRVGPLTRRFKSYAPYAPGLAMLAAAAPPRRMTAMKGAGSRSKGVLDMLAAAAAKRPRARGLYSPPSPGEARRIANGFLTM